MTGERARACTGDFPFTARGEDRPVMRFLLMLGPPWSRLEGPPDSRIMMRTLLSSLALLTVLAQAAPAQVIAIHFKDEKAAKKHKNHLVELSGEMVVIGEPKSGVVWIEATNTLQFNPQSVNQLFVLDPKKPEKDAYFIVDGEKVEASKKNVLSVSGTGIRRVSMVMRDQTLPGLTREYRIRRQELDDFRSERDAFEEGSVEWLSSHHRLVTGLERFELWLQSVGFLGAIRDVQKELKKERKEVKEAALAARADRAMASILEVEAPEELVAASEKHSQGKHVFRAMRSQHLQILYLADGASGSQLISDAEADAAMRLGETAIEGFRAQFVDPHLGEGFEDRIPDRLFLTFVFLPPSREEFAAYLGDLYGYRVRNNPDAERQDARGTWLQAGFPQQLINAWRVGQSNGDRLDHEVDLQAIVCHALGHALAGRHFTKGALTVQQAWLEEAVGNQISYEHLGRNSVTCFGIKKKPTYLKREVAKPGEKTIAVGRRAVYNELALSQGSPIQQIALKDLVELNDADLAKGWSFYDYVARKEGKQGQLWLRALGENASNRSKLVEKWRKAASEILGVQGRDPIKLVEERWRVYAETEQQTD